LKFHSQPADLNQKQTKIFERIEFSLLLHHKVISISNEIFTKYLNGYIA